MLSRYLVVPKWVTAVERVIITIAYVQFIGLDGLDLLLIAAWGAGESE